MRGPAVLPRVPGTPATRTGRERFDRQVLDAVDAVEARWADRLGLVEYAVEDVPQVPEDWDADHPVPLSALVRGRGGRPTRLVLFRRPLEHRAESTADLAVLVHTVVTERVAELLGLPPDDVDPRYRPRGA